MSKTERYLKAARSNTDLDSYVPEIAAAMRSQNIFSNMEMWNRISVLITESPEFFDGVSYSSINKCLNGQPYRAVNKDSYSPSAYAISAVLNKSVEELFGPLPEEELSIRTKDEAKDAFDVWGDNYDKAAFGPIVDVTTNQLSFMLAEKMDEITPNQKNVLTSAFGLNGDPVIGERLAKEMGRSKAAVYFSLERGLRNLKTNDVSGDLKSFIYSP